MKQLTRARGVVARNLGRATARGFTLVEVMIATALLSLLVLGLLTAMRSFAQSEARIDERLRLDDELRVVERFLRSILATASARTRPAPPGGPQEVDFSGRVDEVRWIGVMPVRHGAGGLYRFRLYFYIEPGGDGNRSLRLEFFPFAPGFEAPLDPGQVGSRAVASGVEWVRFRYQDEREDGEALWVEEWPHADRLPRRIGLAIGSPRPWPEMVVDVSAVEDSSPGGVAAGPVVGPR